MLKMTDTMTSQNTDVSSRDILYIITHTQSEHPYMLDHSLSSKYTWKQVRYNQIYKSLFPESAEFAYWLG
jgi:hypothetical protein